MKHGEEVQGQHEEAAFERVRNPKVLVENGKPRLRHNRAIEFRRVGIVTAPPRQGIERVQRTAQLV
jgi:hypothetical protein